MTISRDVYHPEMRKYLDGLATISGGESVLGQFDIAAIVADREGVVRTLGLEGLPLHNIEGVHIAPILSEEMCNRLLAFCDSRKDTFVPNELETYAAQIPEIVLSVEAPEIHKVFSEVVSEVIDPLFSVINGHSPTTITSIQLARYTPENTAHGCWHIDNDSLYTCVISLGPERHTGGGTSFLPNGPMGGVVSIPALPKGWGVLFNGKTINHMGLKVDSGVRDLLVFWLNDDNDECEEHNDST